MALDGMKNDTAVVAQEMSLDALNKAEITEKNKVVIQDMTALSSFKNMISKKVIMTLTGASVIFGGAAFAQDTTKISDTNKPTSSLTLKENDPQDPYTEQVKMPDGSVFMVSKEELAQLEDYKKDLAAGDYANEQEMLEDYKKILTHKREIAKLKAKTEEVKKQKEELVNTVEKKKIILSTAEAEKQKAEAVTKELKQEIAAINGNYKEFFENQLGKKLSDDIVEKLIQELLLWNKDMDADQKIIDEIIEKKNKVGFLTQIEKNTLLGIQKKWETTKMSLPFMQQFAKNMRDSIASLITTSVVKSVAYNK